MAHRVTLIPGDGIGPEVTRAAVRIVDASGVKIEWEPFAAGSEAFAKYGEYIPKELTLSIQRTGVGLKGPVTTPIGGGFSSINVALRKQFELTPTSVPSATCLPCPRAIPAWTWLSAAKILKVSIRGSSMKWCQVLWSR